MCSFSSNIDFNFFKSVIFYKYLIVINNMTIILVDPTSFERNEYKIMIPYSFLCLYPVLKEAGFDVKILNNFNENDLIRILKDSDIEFVGITANTSKFLNSALKISQIAKEFKLPVFWGGSHATMLPEQTLENPYIDGVVVGEGEKTIVELAKNMSSNSLKNVKGIMFKKNSKIVKCPHQKLIKNLNSLPLPAWDLVEDFPRSLLFDNKKYSFIETSRGCPFNCSFCFRQFGTLWRYKSVDRIIKEIDSLLSMGISCMEFMDDNLLLSKKRIMDLCKRIIKEKKNIQWTARGIRVDLISEELLRIMKKAGCIKIALGAESGSQRILNMLNKNVSINKILKAFGLCHKLDIMTTAFFMLDLPTETKKDIDLTMRLANKIQPTFCVFTYYRAYPKTELYKKAIQHNFKEPKTIEEWSKYDSSTIFGFSDVNPIILRGITILNKYKTHIKFLSGKKSKNEILKIMLTKTYTEFLKYFIHKDLDGL